MRTSLVLAATALFAVACASESEEVLPVATRTTGVDTSHAASSKEAARRENGFVRFVHAIPDLTAVDVYSNDIRVFPNVLYGTVTAYFELPEEGYKFRIRPSGQNLAVPMAEADEGVDEGRHYTVVAFREPDEGKAALRIYEDKLTPPETGTAKVRVVNACPDAGELDVFTPGSEEALFTGVDHKAATDYAQVKPMTGVVTLHRKGEETTLASLATTFDVGKVYTIVVYGWSKGSPPTLRTLVIEDRFGTP